MVGPPAAEGRVRELAREVDLPPPLVRLLVARGFEGADEIRRFLHPRLTDLSPPTGLPGLGEAVSRIRRALETGERTLVHGDYDVDGLSATALLLRFLRRFHPHVTPYIPNRLEEGYGLSEAGIEECRARGATLLITVDCGTRALGQVEEARSSGIDCVVTDHHEGGRTLPPAVAVVNPRREGTADTHRDLAGVGVALRVVQTLAEEMGESSRVWEEELDLVALGTIADIVPLRGDNRILTREGLARLGTTDKRGLRALMDVARLRGDQVSGWHVSFVLAPRLNAAGRLGMADRALQLLLTEDEEEARTIARALDRENRSRQKLDQEILREAVEKVEVELDLAETWVIVLASPRWHPGVVGIVASRLMEKYGRPTVLIALEGDRGRGSGRSVPGFDLSRALQKADDLLEAHGGHKMAVGLTVEAAAVPALRERLNKLGAEWLTPAHLERQLRLDGELPLAEVDITLARALGALEPHGLGNPRPLFVARRVELASHAAVVGTNHLRFDLRQGERVLSAVAFGLAPRARELRGAGDALDVAFEVTEDRWRGQGRAELLVRDFLPADDPRGRMNS